MGVHTKHTFLVLIALSIVIGGATVQAGEARLNRKLEKAINAVRSAETDGARYVAAQHLMDMMIGIDPKVVRPKTEADLISLLEIQDNDIECSITVALAQLAREASPGDQKLNSDLEKAIAEIRAGQSQTLRPTASERLWDLLRGIDPKYVEDKTIADMVSLLDIPDEVVFVDVTVALGRLGPRAKAAVPILMARLPAEDCEAEKVFTGVTAADAMRLALRRMGVEPPPYDPKRCK